jgi:hypothetical protein
MDMKRIAVLIAAVALLATAVQASSADGRSSARRVTEFRTMFAVDGPFVGTANPVRDVPGGGLPWQIERVRGKLSGNGALRVDVEGLVLLDGPPVPEALRGTNPVPQFRAIVSCLTILNGAVTTANVSTDPVAASTDGDSSIRAEVALT